MKPWELEVRRVRSVSPDGDVDAESLYTFTTETDFLRSIGDALIMAANEEFRGDRLRKPKKGGTPKKQGPKEERDDVYFSNTYASLGSLVELTVAGSPEDKAQLKGLEADDLRVLGLGLDTVSIIAGEEADKERFLGLDSERMCRWKELQQELSAISEWLDDLLFVGIAANTWTLSSNDVHS